MSHYSHQELSQVIGQIYDCAVDPELWIPTLTRIRDRMDLAYVHLMIFNHNYLKVADHPGEIVFQTQWSQEWMAQLKNWYARMPVIPIWMAADIDQPMSQLQVEAEQEVQQSPFYDQWAKPQNLRDYCHTTLIKRDGLGGAVGAASFNGRSSFDDQDRQTLCLLAPHMRRSMLIGGLLDDGRYSLQLYKNLMDKLSVGIMLVNEHAKLVFANSAADRFLSAGQNLSTSQGKLTPVSPQGIKPFENALARACSGSDADLGLRGNGLPLPGKDGSSAVCYILPLGKSETRRALGPGLAAIFVSTNTKDMPPAVEILTALTGLTIQEARIALAIADGKSPAKTALAMSLSINTVRTHLVHVFAKTQTNSQLELAKFIGNLSLPMLNG